MEKVIRLTESDLIKIVKRVISEDNKPTGAYKTGQQVGKTIKNVVLQTIQIGKTILKAYVVGVFMVFIIYGKLFKLALEIGKKVLSFLASLAKQVGGIVISGAKKVADFAVDRFNKAVQDYVAFFNSLFNVIKSLGAKAWAAALSLASKIGEIWKYISSWASKALQSAIATVKKVGQDIVGGVKDAYNTASDAVSGLTAGLFGEGVLEMMLEDYKYYNSLPIKTMLNEIYFDTRYIL